MPDALVITFAGINCDLELANAFEAAGARVRLAHLNELMHDPAPLDAAHLIGLPGGFSYGDAISAGRIGAHLMRKTLYDAFARAIERGVPMIAPCNGFQIAVQMGLLPGPIAAEPPSPTVALMDNAQGRFVDCWSRVTIPTHTRCVWTAGLQTDDETGLLPVAHGEGRFVPSSDAQLAALDTAGQIAVRYLPDENPNGSVGHVAGICDPTGLILGLMPHPERYTRWTQHPWWTRLPNDAMAGEPLGLRMFRAAVTHAERAAVAV